MGTGEEAVAANEEDCIPFEENAEGEHTFTVPVEALDKGIPCAAFSKSKEMWYDRTLVFRADSLPMDAFQEGAYTKVESLSLADGSYTVSVQLEGGSGKASVASPAALRVENGVAYATIIWSSSNYDYMKVDGTTAEYGADPALDEWAKGYLMLEYNNIGAHAKRDQGIFDPAK